MSDADYPYMTIHQYLTDQSLQEVEIRLQTVGFISLPLLNAIREQYTSCIISHSNTLQCFFQASSTKTTHKNFICSRTSGASSFSIKTYLNGRSVYKSIQYIVRSLNEPMLKFGMYHGIATAKLLGNDQKIYFVTFKGQHLFQGQKQCNLNTIKLRTQFTQQEIELILQYINKNKILKDIGNW
ncbi:Hypothetical_protein [Hexamita inflata]|uniref:Hypothetical_protein n=1 Tax=Hexamita inflata TaxID=28002 RepID=A0AA86RIV5_9EUKA|nr:Hypothetical protein HINF_LOCUS66395 [Hexamita inflata]